MVNQGASKTQEGYFDKSLGVNIVPVLAGAYRWADRQDIAFATTLGSCLSVCVCDRHNGIGGMNHFLLPQAPEHEKPEFSHSYRYGSAAIESLLNVLYAHGAAKNSLMIKIFGGGKVLSTVSQDVGFKNITFTRNFFKRENLRVDSEDVGGLYGRRIIFFPSSGKVLLKTIDARKDIETLANNEMKILKTVSNAPAGDDIELF